MRALTTAQNQALTSTQRTVRFRVLIDATGGGSFQDMTSFAGYDWVQGVSYDEQVDQPVAACQVRLARAVFDLSLSPFMGGSKLNQGFALLQPNRRIKVDQITALIDTPQMASAWTPVFDGYIDDVDPGSEVVTLDCRDLGAKLTDTFIRTERNYGSALGVPITTVMQQILDDNINTPGFGPVTLYAPVVPTFLVLPYKQEKMPVMDALVARVDQIGWALRYKWDPTTSAFRLTLYDVQRAKTLPDWSFGPDDYYDVSGLKVSNKDVRNVVQIIYSNKASGTRDKVIVTNTASTQKYGERFAEITEASASQIDTPAEANAMAQAILSDLCEPGAEHTITTDYFFACELGDYYQFLPNTKHYDSLQKWAVIGVRHELNAEGKCTSAITTRGKPATAYKRWLRIEGRPGVAPAAGYLAPEAPAAVSAYSALGTVVVVYSPLNPERWSRTEVFMDVTGIPDPGVDSVTGQNLPMSQNLRVAAGKTTRFDINSLVPGATYFGRLQVLDVYGNRSPVSGQFSVTTEKVGPYHSNLEGVQSILNANSDFNIFSRGTGTWPDNWYPADGGAFWGENQTFWFTTAALSGRFCLQIYTGTRGLPPPAGTEPGAIQSGQFPFQENDILLCGMWMKWAPLDFAIAHNNILEMWVTFFDASHTFIAGESSIANFDDNIFEWYLGADLSVISPPGCRYVSIGLARGMRGAGIESDPWGSGIVVPGAYVDRIVARRGLPMLDVKIRLTSGPGFAWYPVPQDVPSPQQTVPPSYDYPHLGFEEYQESGGADMKRWRCLVACTMTFTYSSLVHFLSDNSYVTIYLEVWDPISQTWSQQTASRTDGNSGTETKVFLQTGPVHLRRDSLFRIVALPSDDVEMTLREVDFSGICVSRADA